MQSDWGPHASVNLSAGVGGRQTARRLLGRFIPQVLHEVPPTHSAFDTLGGALSLSLFPPLSPPLSLSLSLTLFLPLFLSLPPPLYSHSPSYLITLLQPVFTLVPLHFPVLCVWGVWVAARVARWWGSLSLYLSPIPKLGVGAPPSLFLHAWRFILSNHQYAPLACFVCPPLPRGGVCEMLLQSLLDLYLVSLDLAVLGQVAPDRSMARSLAAAVPGQCCLSP